MKINKSHVLSLVILLLMISLNKMWACSMYKITIDGKTMVGCNHDAWLTTPKIWFENAKKPNEYGAAFTGAREVAINRTTPQSGMNTVGLTFSRLTSYYPSEDNPFKNRLKIPNEADYLSDILHKCATIEDVKNYIEQYDHSFFMDDIFIYVDSSGNYLIVEPYNLIEGNNPNYILANFCPSITDNNQARKLDRYRNGEDFLKNHKTFASLAFCTALSDTMHVCRNRNGDGTLITSIWDTKDKSVNLYFYHDYDTAIQFNLIQELAKGDHKINVQDLFKKNAEFERLVNYKTPSNSIEVRFSLVSLAGLLSLISIMLGISQCWKRKYRTVSLTSAVIFSLLNVILIFYTTVLIKNTSIFYFDVPYKHYNSSLISASSYIPFLLLLSFVPVLGYTINSLKSSDMGPWVKVILVSNNVVYFILILGFGYWGLFNFWN